MARRPASAVQVMAALRAMNPDVRKTVLDMARDEFRVPVAATKVTRKRRAALVQADPEAQ